MNFYPVETNKNCTLTTKLSSGQYQAMVYQSDNSLWYINTDKLSAAEGNYGFESYHVAAMVSNFLKIVKNEGRFERLLPCKKEIVMKSAQWHQWAAQNTTLVSLVAMYIKVNQKNKREEQQLFNEMRAFKLQHQYDDFCAEQRLVG